MKTIWNTCKQKSLKAFTLLELLMVLAIISVLMLLFVPNLSKQKEAVDQKGGAAIVKVVESQAELYELAEEAPADLSQLEAAGYITKDQAQKYRDYYEKNTDQEAKLK